MASMQLPALLLIFSIICPALVICIDINDLLKLLSSNAKCSNLTYENDLNLDKFGGVWYISYQVNPLLASDPPCQNFDIKTTSLDTLDIKMNSRIVPGMVMQAKATGEAIDSTKPAVMTWTWNFLPDMPEKTIIVETDYKNYAILATCNVYELVVTGFILSRDINIPDKYFMHGKEVLGQYFDTSIGRSMRTDNCDLDPIAPYEQIIELGSSGMEDLFKEVFAK